MTRSVLEDIVFCTHVQTRDRFKKAFANEIDEFISLIDRADSRLTTVYSTVAKDDRSRWVVGFLFNALSNLLTSFHFLISGFMVASGNHMRHFGESIAMALLCSHTEIETFTKLKQDPSRFPVHKALDMVKRRDNATLLGLDTENWTTFRRTIAFFDKYSHASALALAQVFIYSKPQHFKRGCEFDESKVDIYQKEIGLRISACQTLYETIEQAEQRLRGMNK